MSIFNPYGNMPLLKIRKERYTIFRFYILLIGIISFVNSAFLLFGKDIYIFFSADLPCVAADAAYSAFEKSNFGGGGMLCALSLLLSLFYVAVYILSAQKYRFVIFAAVFYLIDCIAVAVNIANVSVFHIVGHILIIIIFVWGIFATKKLIDAEIESDRGNFRS